MKIRSTKAEATLSKYIVSKFLPHLAQSRWPHERAIAKNLLHQLIVYATGAPITFGDRPIVDSILNQCEDSNYGVRSLIHSLIQSKIFLNK